MNLYIQLAAALRIQTALAHSEGPPLTFLSADDRLLAIAQLEDLSTGNPNNYPGRSAQDPD